MTQWRRLFVAASLTLIVRTGLAVEPGLPSKTAVVAAAARALATHDPDPSVRNPDWLAERFLGVAELRLLEGTPWMSVLDQGYQQASKTPEIDTLVRVMLVRTRFIDERLSNAIENGARQVIVLGAGFDSRAYRLRPFLKDTRVFEVDYGPTQAYKQRRVQEVLGCLPANVVYVPIDFTKDKLGDVLAKAGYRPDQKAVFIWEGVSYYLPEEAVQGTLRYIASHSTPESTLVADFIVKSLIDQAGKDIDPAAPPMLRGALVQAKRMAELGEPWLFGIPDGGERSYFRSVGLELKKLLPLSGAEALTRYRTRRDGTWIGSAPTSDFSPGYLVEAVVPRR